MLRLYFYLKSYLNNLSEREEGQDLIEYSLIVVLITLAGAAGMAVVGNRITQIWDVIVGMFP